VDKLHQVSILASLGDQNVYCARDVQISTRTGGGIIEKTDESRFVRGSALTLMFRYVDSQENTTPSLNDLRQLDRESISNAKRLAIGKYVLAVE
jgi:hypothetical protein